jgi:hypothetical protein
MATGTERSRVARTGLDGPEWLAVALAVATGVVHVYLGVVDDLLVFVLAGVGFFAGVAVFFTRYWRRWFYLVAAAYAGAQVALWLAFGMRNFELGVVDKTVQVALVAVALVLYTRE